MEQKNDEVQEKKESESETNGDATEDTLTKCQKERDEYLDGWKRAKADLLNYKKDEARRFEMTLKFANESMIHELISVLDSFDLALITLEKEDKAEKGMYLIKSQLEDILKQYGLEHLIISTGQKFDPALHEAIAEIESDKPSGTIIEEVERGYMMNGKLIRPARVKMAK